RPADPLEARRRGIAHIHQELSLCPHLSAAENIFLGREPHHVGWLDRRRLDHDGDDLLKTFHHPAITPQHRVSDLPPAARQIVEICRALAQRASLILMDEPTSSLQRADVDRLFFLIRRLRESGISIIYIRPLSRRGKGDRGHLYGAARRQECRYRPDTGFARREADHGHGRSLSE